MASYRYRYGVNGAWISASESLTSVTAIDACRRAMESAGAGATGKIERRKVLHSRRSGHDFGPWLPHRAYVVGADGIVRRTDRTPSGDDGSHPGRDGAGGW